MYLSVIIPVYNEEERIRNIKKVTNFLNQQDFDSELIIVNDGSTDNTLSLLQKEYFKDISSHPQLTLVTYKQNQGKGFAVRKGMAYAKGKYRLFLDVDLSTPITEFKKLTPFLKNHDVLIGSRKMKGARLRQRQPLLRETLGKIFTLLSQLVLGVWISDFTCGFKCFSAASTKKIFKKAVINRWGFDSEILFLSQKMGFSIKEVPVSWKNDPNTKVKFPHDIISSLKELLEIRKNEAFKKYA